MNLDLDKILTLLSQSIIIDARKLLKQRKKNKNSSGKLNRSFTYKVDKTKTTISAEDYANYVDSGTRKMKGNFYLTDAVDQNINTYGEQLADDAGEQIIKEILKNE